MSSAKRGDKIFVRLLPTDAEGNVQQEFDYELLMNRVAENFGRKVAEKNISPFEKKPLFTVEKNGFPSSEPGYEFILTLNKPMSNPEWKLSSMVRQAMVEEDSKDKYRTAHGTGEPQGVHYTPKDERQMIANKGSHGRRNEWLGDIGVRIDIHAEGSKIGAPEGIRR